MNFKEAFDYIDQTNHERKKGIKIIDKEIFLDSEDIKLVRVKKSDGQIGIVIVYKGSIKLDSWWVWYPSRNQQNKLPVIASVLNDIDNYNIKKWQT